MNDKPKITLPLDMFLDLFLNSHDNNYINPWVAEVISIIDKNEQVFHVEFYDPSKTYFEVPYENNPTEKQPAVLWRIKSWRVSENLYKIRKEKSDAAIKEDLERKEKIKLLISAIQKMTQLPIELCEPLAVKIVLSGNKIAARNFNVDI